MLREMVSVPVRFGEDFKCLPREPVVRPRTVRDLKRIEDEARIVVLREIRGKESWEMHIGVGVALEKIIVAMFQGELADGFGLGWQAFIVVGDAEHLADEAHAI